MKKTMKKMLSAALAGVMVCGLMACSSNSGKDGDEPGKSGASPDGATPFARYGHLQLCSVDHDGDAATPERKQLCDENGNPVQLKGMSSFGLQWEDGCWVLNDSAFDALAYDWKCDVIRLAMYVQEDGYATSPAEILERVETGIQLTIDRGMYVIVDWHSLSPGDPTSDDYLKAGMELAEEGGPFYDIAKKHPEYNGPQLFFAYIAEKYGDEGNVIFETANEPNGLGNDANAKATWTNKLKPYHEGVLSAIREYDADDIDNIVICGTDNWSQFVDAPASDPIDDDYVMYTVHFYAGTHDAGYDSEEQYWLRAKIDNALNSGIAVFCTEWGTSLATGDGGPFIDFADRWLSYFDENGISWCAWSLAKKDEVSASCTSETAAEPTDLNGDEIPEWDSSTLSVSGNYVRAKIRGEEAPIYTESTMTLDFEDGIEMASIDPDSVNKDIILEQVTIEDKAIKIGNALGTDIWQNRVRFSDLGTIYGIYRDLAFDVIVKDEELKSTLITIKPVIQSEATSWWGDTIEAQVFSAEHFTSMGNGYSVCHATFPLQNLNPTPTDELGHIVLLISAGTLEEFYVDNIGFSSSTNGDIKYAAKLPDNPGEFVSIPYTFESGTREGWVTEGASKLDYEDFTVGLAETTAMKFPVSFGVENNEWEDGARISSSFLTRDVMSLEDTKKIKSIEFDVYIEPDKATTGELAIYACPIPDGAGYWYEAGNMTIDPVNGGESITNSEGTTLLKYHISIPFSEDGSFPYSDQVPLRNLVLIFANAESDYSGYIYCDNIEFAQ